MIEHSKDLVTVVIAQNVKPGRERDYEHWVSQITQVANTYPGYLGNNIVRPQPGVRSEYVAIFRFDCYDHLKTWMTSRDRHNLVAQVKPLVVGNPHIQEISGLDAWFSLPGQALQTPPRYKTALLTGAAVYVLISILNRWLTPILLQLVQPWLAALIICAIMVTLLTYVVMPRVVTLFRGWLYP